MTEEDFLRTVIDLAKLTGWKVSHTRPAWTNKGYRTPIQGDAGFPDLVLVRERIIFAELKSEKGKLTDAQQAWRDAILAAGGEYYIWKPSDFDWVTEILKR